MISLESLMQLRKELFADADKLVAAKGNDYNSQQQKEGDTLFNLRVSSLLGVVPSPVDGVLVRLGDKLMRLISLTRPNTQQQVKDESVRDTLLDVLNYTTYIWAFLQEGVGSKLGVTVCMEDVRSAVGNAICELASTQVDLLQPDDEIENRLREKMRLPKKR